MDGKTGIKVDPYFIVIKNINNIFPTVMFGYPSRYQISSPNYNKI